MLSAVSFLVLLSIGLIHAAPITEEPCEAGVYTSTGPCAGTIWTNKPCENATVHIATTSYKSCDVVDFTWAYPMYNLTFIVETPYTKQHQPYELHLDNRRFRGSEFSWYRILNGQETKITSDADTVIEKSDSNYEVIFKIQALTTVSLYIFPVHYSATQL
jgi:hypothetical protein